jgi:hypothetical protein
MQYQSKRDLPGQYLIAGQASALRKQTMVDDELTDATEATKNGSNVYYGFRMIYPLRSLIRRTWKVGDLMQHYARGCDDQLRLNGHAHVHSATAFA